jgi:divinyl chlorophyllide a 8-vinyl-reductase
MAQFHMAFFVGLLCLTGSLVSLVPVDAVAVGKSRVVVAGATGYIGRRVVQELVSRRIPVAALVRSIPSATDTIARQYLNGSEIIVCNALNEMETMAQLDAFKPTAGICCLASRSGLGKDSWAVDYGGGVNFLRALETHQAHIVLLSAFCVGKPLLQFQFAKLKLEEEIRASQRCSHSIVRPTAYFKSLDGQIESVRKGNPIMYFGDGTCAANAVSEKELASYMVDCAVDPQSTDMLNETRNIGGPDVPPIPKRMQGEMIFDTLNIPPEHRKFIALPLGIFDVLIGVFTGLESVFRAFKATQLAGKFEDGAEIARIVRYYASEPMVCVGPKEVIGNMRLADHFATVAARGGQLEEIDQMTTTMGVLDLLSKNEYAVTGSEEYRK